jgi:predicted CoA-binding protein
MAKVVAIIGASSDRRKFGNKALRAFQRQGHAVVPVNPNEAEVEGLRTVASVLDIPGDVDMATFYVPPDVGARVIEEVAKKKIPEVWLNPGADGDEVLAKAEALGIRPIIACSIRGVGEDPYDF